MHHNSLLTALALGICSLPGLAQVCPQGTVHLQNDVLPGDPSGSQQVAVISGICPGDKAASVFDVSGFTAPVRVRRAGILFAGPGGSQQATGRLEIYDGVTFAPNGSATLGPNVYTGTVVSYPVNTLQMINVSAFNITVSSGKLVVAFSIISNPNEVFPPFGCTFGYTASFASDSTLPSGSPCGTTPETNLIYDASTGWWDIPDFQIGGNDWCGLAFNGNWVIRACVDEEDPWTDLGGGTAGVNGVPALTGSGPLTASSTLTLDLQQGPPSMLALLWLSTSSSPFNALGGTVHPVPFLDQVLLATSPAGGINGGITFPGGVPSGTTLYFQYLLQDASVIHGITLSNGVRGITP